MNKVEIQELYGQSVYQIRLSVAASLFSKNIHSAEEALAVADEFVAALLIENKETVVLNSQ